MNDNRESQQEYFGNRVFKNTAPTHNPCTHCPNNTGPLSICHCTLGQGQTSGWSTVTSHPWEDK